MQLDNESIRQAETPLRDKISQARHAYMQLTQAHVNKNASTVMQKDVNHISILAFFAQATDCAHSMQPGDNARAVIHLYSVCEYMLAVGTLYLNDDIIALSKLIREGIHNHLSTNQELFEEYLQVTVQTEMTHKQKVARQFTTGSHFATSSMSSASLADPIVAPFANHAEVRNHIKEANEQLKIRHIIHLPHHISRFRLNTEHGQAINVFRAEIYKPNAQDEFPLYVIAVHGNASSAASEFPSRLLEMDIFLARTPADRVILLTPDLPGSVASGGYAKSLGEISQNSVQKLVKHLLLQGVDPSQIVVRGHSLGGLISTHAVHTLNKENIKVSLISVDSLAQTRKFLPKSLAPIAGQLALKHFDAPAYKFFDELDANRRFCIHKMGDQVIPPSCSVMFNLPGNTLNNNVPAITRNDCFLITDANMDHNDDIVQLDDNPCITALTRIHADRKMNQEVLLETLRAKLMTGVQTFNAYCEKHTRCIKFGQALIAELPEFIGKVRGSNLKAIDCLRVLLGWIMHHHDLILPAYQIEADRRHFHKDAPFISFCTSMLSFAKEYPVLNQLILNAESKAHCVALYQALVLPPEQVIVEQVMM